MKQLSQKRIQSFQSKVYDFFRKYQRRLPWRSTRNPYHILVSEIMLQQTQVSRVLVKYQPFLRKFPSFKALSRAPLRDVLQAWQGLGYNRRAMALQRCAQTVVHEFNGKLPRDPKALVKLPGIGQATAGAIVAFAFNKPVAFIETNIRTVFIHFFFAGRTRVNDTEIFSLVSKTIDRVQPRQWYYGLMDYGAYLKKKIGNKSRHSAHYTRQAQFAGSNRQLRGMLIRTLLEQPYAELNKLIQYIPFSKRLVMSSLSQMVQEGLITNMKNRYTIQ